MCSGKSTVGELLAERLHVPFFDLDAVADRYYAEVDRGLDVLLERREEVGWLRADRWWQPARIHALERFVEEHTGGVMAVGAGHTHYENPSYVQWAARALAPFDHVVLLRPSPDIWRSVDVLRARAMRDRGSDWTHEGEDILLGWVESLQNQRLATQVVYTEGRSPEDVADLVCGVRP